MTTQLTPAAAPPPAPAAAAQGTVFDIGYRNYTGPREGRRRPRLSLFRSGVRMALGLGRGGRAKILPFLFLGVLWAIALVLALVAGAAVRLGGPEARQQIPSHLDYYGIVSMIVFVFAAVVGPELLCRDRREGTINLYLVRPLTGTDYVVARWLSLFAVMCLAVLGPQVLLWLALSLGDPQPLKYVQAHWRDVPNFLAGGFAMATYVTSLALMVSAFTTRRALASVFLVGVFVITTPFTLGLAQEIPREAGRWMSMFNLTFIPLHVNDLAFGAVSEMTDRAPAKDFSGRVLVAWWAAWVVVPSLVLWNRYRRLAP